MFSEKVREIARDICHLGGTATVFTYIDDEELIWGNSIQPEILYCRQKDVSFEPSYNYTYTQKAHADDCSTLQKVLLNAWVEDVMEVIRHTARSSAALRSLSLVSEYF